MSNLISLDILISYTIPLSYLLSLYVFYTAFHILLILDNAVYVLFPLLHYATALLYIVHKIAANFSLANVLIYTASFVLFPLHFILTLYYRILFSLKLIRTSPSQSEETPSLLKKTRADNAYHTFLLTFTCIQIPLEVFLQMALYLNHFRSDTGTTVLTIANLTVCLLLSVYGAVSYFRYETQNIAQYLLNRANLKRVSPRVQVTRTYSKTPSNTMSQFQVDSNNVRITDSHSLLFKLIVSVKYLLHNYIRLVSVGLVLFFYPTFTILFLAGETIVFFLILIFHQVRSNEGLSIGYAILQSLAFNFCLVEYKVKLSRKLIFISYFVVMFAENVLFNYLWYFKANWTRRHKTLFTATIWSLVVCQIIHFLLLFVYLFFYKPKLYEIDYYAEDTEDEGNETNLSENNEEEIRANGDKKETTGEQTARYENVKPKEKDKTIARVDRIRAPPNDETRMSQVAQTVLTDSYTYAKTQKRPSSQLRQDTKPALPAKPAVPSKPAVSASKYKELINDLEEQTVYPQSGNENQGEKEDRRKSLSATCCVNPEQRDSWKYVVEEIDDQIHKSTSNLNKSRLHLSSDRLGRKHDRSTDSLDRTIDATPRGSLTLPATQLVPSETFKSTQSESSHQLSETSHTKSYSHVKQGGSDLFQGTSVSDFFSEASADPAGASVDPIDRQEDEEIVVESRFADDTGRRTSRYSSQEFVETRRVDETTYEERKRHVKKLNTTSLV